MRQFFTQLTISMVFALAGLFFSITRTGKYEEGSHGAGKYVGHSIQSSNNQLSNVLKHSFCSFDLWHYRLGHAYSQMFSKFHDLAMFFADG